MTVSTNTFKHINKTDSTFILYHKQYALQLNHIKIFLQTNKHLSPTISDSYIDVIVSLMINYDYIYQQKFTSLYTLKALTAFETLQQHPDFPTFNNSENHLPQIGLGLVINFIHHQLNQMTLENFTDHNLNIALNQTTVPINFKAQEAPQKRLHQEQNLTGLVYPRDLNQSMQALKIANWQCLVDPNHQTFINAQTNQPYMEIHHLIPMAFQDFFANNLDISVNIICLCPICHQKLTFAKDNIRIKMLTHMFNLRHQALAIHGIDITLNELLQMYDIVVD